MVFAVDFDGTICEHDFPDIGKEMPNAIRTLMDLQNTGHLIIIWTCRCYPYLTPMIEWLGLRGFKPDGVNCNAYNTPLFAYPKILADVYIDDRNLGGFPGWDKVREIYLPEIKESNG